MLDAKTQEQINQFNEQWHAVDKLYEEYAKSFGHSYTTLEVLGALYETGDGYTQKQLCQKTFLPKQSVNTIVKSFLQQGYVEMKETDADRRNKMVRLTPAGRAYAGRVVGTLWQKQDDAMARMTYEQRELLLQALVMYEETLRESLGIKRRGE